MSLTLRYESITFNSGTKVDLPSEGVVIFTGPNNAGKSQALRDILGYVQDGIEYGGTVLSAAETTRSGSSDDAQAWVRDSLSVKMIDGTERVSVEGWGDVTPNDVVSYWANPPGLGPLTRTFVLHADGTTRLSAGNAPGNFDYRVDSPSHPLQRAARNPDLEAAINSVCQAAFGVDAFVDRYAGSVIPLRIGTKPPFQHVDGMPLQGYLDALAALPTLETQGDGFKSFLGLMMQLLGGVHQTLLIDEPEAFLHPPQARLLGRLLATHARDKQVFLATHSSGIVQGALEADVPVTIIRLRRDRNTSHAAVLDDAAVTELWSDSLLRYSDVLDGLFHDAVVVCESDSDCRLYSAVSDIVQSSSSDRSMQLLFTHCGGKARLPMVIKALRAVQVPVVAIADFDVLREARDVQKIVEALGGDWGEIQTLQRVIASALSDEGRPPSRTAVSEAVADRLLTASDPLSRVDIDDIRKLLKTENGWDRAKRAGMSGLPQGEPTAAAETLVSKVDEHGLLVVPVGELERFFPQVGGHGPSWVSEVLEQDLHASTTGAVHEFVIKLLSTARRLNRR
ncbi:AAA family ATPase [Leucobacter massiliensis]|uniref:AAA family ATPase n=1 Tax=Leucobacter massiliensis TaxID=1686285 RepID=UPI0015E3CACF|nr:AAA family ATPase [Leucobacter massiliensis]